MSVRAILSSVVLVILIASSSAVDITPIQKVEESFVQILGQSRHVLSFVRFAHGYGKMYQHAEEIKHRFSIFKKNLDFIRSTNKKGLSYKLGVNEFADLTFQEFQRNKIGAAQDRFATLKGNRTERALSETITPVPSARDWREDGIVSRVKNQGSCDSSYAFSATGAVEAAYHKKHGIGISLSEQELVDCSDSYGNKRCNGGVHSNAFRYIQSNGLMLGATYRYSGRSGTCRSVKLLAAVSVTRYVSITSGAEDVLKQAVGSIGPVSISLNIDDSLQFYNSGVYASTECQNTLDDLYHDVLAVGYGTENGVPYWIIKNSWGFNWGEKGYFKMVMGKNMCGVATNAAYPVVA